MTVVPPAGGVPGTVKRRKGVGGARGLFREVVVPTGDDESPGCWF